MEAEGAAAGPAEQGRFVTGSLMRHVLVMALSGTFGLLFTFLVDFLALWWIGRIGREDLIAAVGIAGTIQFAVFSVAIGMMIATVALVARQIGMGNRAAARRIAGLAMALTVGVMSILSLLMVAGMAPVLAASGAEGAVADAARTFLLISLPSLPLIAVGLVASAVLRAVGDAWRSMAITMSGGAVAIVADPFLIVWSGWGVAGAAVSIVLARAAMAALGVYYVVGVRDMLARPSAADARRWAGPYLAVALPAIATQVSTPFGNWVLTREMAAFGESAVAGWGVVMRLTILAFGGIFALSGAIGGIIGQNWGAGRPDRVAGAYIAALKFCAVYTLLAWAAMAALSAAFNNLGRPLRSTWANWTRDGILMFPCAAILGGLAGAAGVVWAQALANVIVGGVAAVLAWHYIRGLQNGPGAQAARRASEEAQGAEQVLR